MLNVLLNQNLTEIPLFDSIRLMHLLIRLFLDLTFTILLIRYIYYPFNKKNDYLFSYIILGLSVFLLVFLLGSIKIKLGFALGLFAIFGIVRYRTQIIAVKDMTYLFVVITLAVVNAVNNKKIDYTSLLLADFIILILVYVLERVSSLKKETYIIILYEKIEFIKPEKKELLIQDLKNRLGLEVIDIEIGEINFLKDTALIKVFFKKNTKNNYFLTAKTEEKFMQ